MTHRQLEWSTSTLFRIETGRSRPQPRNVRTLPARPKRWLPGARAGSKPRPPPLMCSPWPGSRLYDETARNDPQPFKQRLAAVTRDWAYHRAGGSVSPTGCRLGSGGSC